MTETNLTGSDLIQHTIGLIAKTSGKNDKISMIKAGLEIPDFERVLLASHDPYATYGIQKRPAAIESKGDGMFDERTWAILDALRERQATGNDAINRVAVEMSRLSPLSRELFWNIITKDLKAGFGESSINKAKKGLIKTFPYMRCSLVSKIDLSKWNWEAGIFSQEKADGMFANVNNEKGGIVSITSRQGTPFLPGHLPTIEADMKKYMEVGLQYHGEIVVKIDGVIAPREIGNGILNSVAQGGSFEPNQTPVYLIWDAIPLTSVVPKGKYDAPYALRIAGIKADLDSGEATSVDMIPTRAVYSIKEAYDHYAEMLAQGKEGTIVKKPSLMWKDGTSLDQLKLKLEVDVDLKVVSINQGKVGSRIEGQPGALVCQSSDGLLVVDVTVKNEAMRHDVSANPDSWIDSIIVVRSNEITPPTASNKLHSLFLPRMVEAAYRTDKTEADSLKQVIEQFEAAKANKAQS